MARPKTNEKKFTGNNIPFSDIFEHFLFFSRELYDQRNSNIPLAGRLSIATLKIFAFHIITKMKLERNIRRYFRVARCVKYYFDFFSNLFS